MLQPQLQDRRKVGDKIGGRVGGGEAWNNDRPSRGSSSWRYLLRLDDDALVYLQTRGFRHGPHEVLAAVAAGESVDPDEYFFRVYMTFETASATYGWINRTMAIGSAMRLANAVIYDAYLIQ